MRFVLGNFCQELAPAVASTDAPSSEAVRSMATSIIAALRTVVSFDHSVTFAYRGSAPPIDLFDTFSAEQRHVFVTLYQQGPYLLDPFFRSAGERQKGFWRMRELAPDRFYSSEYFHSYYVRTGMAEEIGFFMPTNEDVTIVLSLMRLKRSGVFSSREVIALRAVEPVITALIERCWSNATELFDTAMTHGRGSKNNNIINLSTKVPGWSELKLTCREASVVDLVLQGHSSESIADRLGISRGTVKVHRRNVYHKLDISSQAELLAIYIHRVLKR